MLENAKKIPSTIQNKHGSSKSDFASFDTAKCFLRNRCGLKNVKTIFAAKLYAVSEDSNLPPRLNTCLKHDFFYLCFIVANSSHTKPLTF